MHDPDADDLACAATGDERAFSRLVDRHLPMVHRLAWRTLGVEADAEDVAQETFLRAHRQLPRWRSGQARFSTWLYRVALNLCQDHLRRRRDWVPSDTMELVDHDAAPERALERTDVSHRVADAIAAVRPWGGDVASGVERDPGAPGGRKDPSKVRRFVAIARAAAPAQAPVLDPRPYDWTEDT